MAKGSARKAIAGESGDFARYLRLLELYKRDGDWDEYLALAMSPQFQQDLAADAAGPLGVLAFALEQAVRLRRIGDAAALTLAAARWTRRLSVRTASGTGPAAGPDLAGGAGPAESRMARARRSSSAPAVTSSAPCSAPGNATTRATAARPGPCLPPSCAGVRP